MQLNVGGEEKGEKVKESPERTCDEIGLELALEEKRRWPLFSPSTADIESISATHPLQKRSATARAVHLSASDAAGGGRRCVDLWKAPSWRDWALNVTNSIML